MFYTFAGNEEKTAHIKSFVCCHNIVLDIVSVHTQL